MSTYWDVACMTCDSELCLHGNHAEKAAWEIVKAAPRLAAAGTGIKVDVSESFGFYGETSNLIDCGWFVTHADHALVAKNEYGNVGGMCGEWSECPKCADKFSCNRKRGHDGEHDPRYEK